MPYAAGKRPALCRLERDRIGPDSDPCRSRAGAPAWHRMFQLSDSNDRLPPIATQDLARQDVRLADEVGDE